MCRRRIGRGGAMELIARQARATNPSSGSHRLAHAVTDGSPRAQIRAEPDWFPGLDPASSADRPSTPARSGSRFAACLMKPVVFSELERAIRLSSQRAARPLPLREGPPCSSRDPSREHPARRGQRDNIRSSPICSKAGPSRRAPVGTRGARDPGAETFDLVLMTFRCRDGRA